MLPYQPMIETALNGLVCGRFLAVLVSGHKKNLAGHPTKVLIPSSGSGSIFRLPDLNTKGFFRCLVYRIMIRIFQNGHITCMPGQVIVKPGQ
jgi:hypothetical protein